MIKVYAKNINSIENNTQTLAKLSIDRQEAVSRLKWEKAKLRSIGGELLLIHALNKMGEEFCLPLEIEKTKKGKPRLKNYKNIEYNISHSGEYCVLCLDTLMVGIDIQLHKPINTALAKRFFSEEEQEYIFSKPEAEREKCFYDIWSLKESLLKCTGEGIAKGLKSTSIVPEENVFARHICGEDFYFKTYGNAIEGYSIAVCAKQKDFQREIQFCE